MKEPKEILSTKKVFSKITPYPDGLVTGSFAPRENRCLLEPARAKNKAGKEAKDS